MSEQITYRGFDTPDQNAEAVELWLGEDFNCHLPGVNAIQFCHERELLVTVEAGTTLIRGRHGVRIWDARWDQ